MEKKYTPFNFETKIFQLWSDLKLSEHKNQIEKPNFSIILPPPNVTGNLHLGHAWDVSIQDAIIRFKKLTGFNTYWVAGKDHAGIATQVSFEKYLTTLNKSRKDFTRQKFLKELTNWTKINSEKIDSQWERMGLLLDYKNQKFTLDKDISLCVNDTFKKMYKKGLIYKKLALVNWDIKLQTAISDIEVIKKETITKLYTFLYQVVDSSIILEVSTTRPETMFADTCLVVNPKDHRYHELIGKKVINPANNEIIEIISDHYVDLEYGTGIMKCTPGHDFNDYKIGNKYHQNYTSCMNVDGTMNELANEFMGLDRFVCREQLVAKLKQENKLINIIEQISFVGYSERTNEIIEPLLSKQWFVSVQDLARKIIEEQKNDTPNIQVFPKYFNNTLIKWLENIEDWCISRQLWWGHQIPAWYHKITGKIVVDKPLNLEDYVQDESVFDTWFSSSLWPFVTLGQHTNEVEYKLFFPTDILVTAYDIIFFWVARMMMMSKEITNQIPFKKLFIHGLIRDEEGRKLSKSLGNFVDLFELCDKFGVDALRLFLLSNSTIGQDLIFNEIKLTSAANFLNKLWNIAIFIDINKLGVKSINKINILNNFDQWILYKANLLINDFKEDFDNFNYVVGIKKLIDFIRTDFSGTYIDLNRFRLKDDFNFISVCHEILKNILIMLHPICCFITEKIYLDLYNDKDSILLENWPIPTTFKNQPIIDIALLILENIRNFKWNNKLSKKNELSIKIYSEIALDEKIIKDILKFENSEVVFLKKKFSKKFINENEIATIVDHFVIIYQKIASKDNFEVNKKIISNLESEIKRSKTILNNKGFIKKAPKELIEKETNNLILNQKKLKEFLE